MLALIVGIGPNRVIGKGNELPWNIPEDLKNFKEVTKGNSVIMGLKTFESIGRPLPGRNNIILSLDPVEIPNCTVCTSIPEAIKAGEEFGKDIFCIGGVSIYKQFVPIVEKLYISWIKKEYDGDMFFPEFDLDEWEPEETKEFNEFKFVIYKRKAKQ
ncbi:dihydrofolate reductase [Candidatus Woesearchaeota archaeon]|nr:dihydrofolate reductase [Candidatus Woesearchaeota archaeon]